ncbi:zinc ribbon domain-containing protein [bacterium]|nr:zinc ribbon domain-containing protein [bacterium]
MPTYTYHCDNCGVRFDQYQKFSDDPLVVCPECGEPALRKVYQPVGIVFKGKGFYATDNRSPSGQSYSSDKEDSSKKESDSKSETKSESKSETKSSESKKKDD